MCTDTINQPLCDAIFKIFKKYNLTSAEIEHLLAGTGPDPDSENLNEASCDIADLFINENVSIIQASKAFTECYRLFSSRNQKLTPVTG